MRLRHPSGRIVHLNFGIALPARDYLTTVEGVNRAFRERFGAGRLGISLHFPYDLAASLAADARGRTRLRATLVARDLEVATPGSGAETDWSDPDRVEHTLDLARILVDLLPDEEVRGTVTTCGLGPRDGWDEPRQLAATRNLQRLSAGLTDLAWRTGRAVRAGFRPQPGYVLDSAEETVAALARVDKDRLGVNLDLATVLADWPDPRAGIDRMTDAGLSVIGTRITDPAGAWQPVLRHLLAADTARTEYVDVDTSAAGQEAARDLAYVLEELTHLGLTPEQQPCPAP